MVLSTSTRLSGGNEPAEHARGRGYFRCVLQPRQDRSPGHHTMVPVAGAPPRCAIAHRRSESRFDTRGIPVPLRRPRDLQAFRDYLALHRAVDVMLDTFPYAGGTTTCHSLWMGVPVVSLVGVSAPSRGGVSLLKTVGLDELVADTRQRYLDIACDLASDTGKLAVLRTSMPARMSASP